MTTFIKVGKEYVEFDHIGTSVVIYPTAKIINPGTMSIDSNVIIDDFVFVDGGLGIDIGRFVHIGSHTIIVGGGRLKMGDFSGLSGGVRMYTGGEDYYGEYLTNPTVPHPYRKPYRSQIVMGKHSLIGSGCVVLAGPDGIEIGEGASVGALSLVKHDLEPWTVYAGTPATPIGVRDKGRMLELEHRLREVLG